jgi:hypothetical protein
MMLIDFGKAIDTTLHSADVAFKIDCESCCQKEFHKSFVILNVLFVCVKMDLKKKR